MAHWRSKATRGLGRPLFWTSVRLAIFGGSLVAGLWLI
jgi:hypothetical protein